MAKCSKCGNVKMVPTYSRAQTGNWCQFCDKSFLYQSEGVQSRAEIKRLRKCLNIVHGMVKSRYKRVVILKRIDEELDNL